MAQRITNGQKPKLLIVGPSETGVPGGITTVLTGMRKSEALAQHFEVSVFASCTNGALPVRLAFTFFSYLKFLLCVRKYDVFHLHVASYGSTFRKMLYVKAIRAAGKKVVLHLHSGKYIIFYEGLPPRKQAKMVRFLQGADAVIALSEDWKEKFESLFGLQNCITIHNGVDTQHFAKAAANPSAVAGEFLFLGRLTDVKGIYDLLDAVALVKERGVRLHCVLAGEGDIAKVKEIIAAQGLTEYITLAGWVNETQKLVCLQNASTLLLPSHGEALPMAILEAMAAGKAVISTTVGAIPALVAPENGILMQPQDVQALADAMIKCATDSEYLQAASTANMAKIQACYSKTAMDDALITCLEGVL